MRDSLNSSKHNPQETGAGGHEEHKGFSFESFVFFVFKLVTPENIWAFILFLIAIALIVFTTDSSPVWIYQGF